MRFYNQLHALYPAVARSLFTHILDHASKTVETFLGRDVSQFPWKERGDDAIGS